MTYIEVFYPSWVCFCVWYKFVVISFFCMYLSRSPHTIRLRGYFYPILCFFPLCGILIDHRDRFISGLSILFHWTMHLFLCQYQTVLIQWPCNIVQCQVWWSLLLCSSFSKLLWLFGIVHGSILIFEMFVLYLWNEMCPWYVNKDCIESINCFG